MIEIPPSLQKIEEKAINLLTDPLCQDILARIDHDYLYWDKVKYLAPQSMQPELLWAAVKLKRAIGNTNKLIRQFVPKHTNFDEVTDKKIASIQKKINSRPRKKLKFETPKAEFFKRIA